MSENSKISNVYGGSFLSILTSIVSIVGGLLVIIPGLVRARFNIPTQAVNVLIDIGNIIISAFFIYILLYRGKPVALSECEDLFGSENEAEKVNLIERMAVVMNQFKKYLLVYVVTCLLFYCIQLAKNYYAFNSAHFLYKISNLNSIDDVAKPLGSDHLIVSTSQFFLYFLLDCSENLINFISALGLIYSFRVLYFNTVNERNESLISSMIFNLFSILFALLYVLLLLIPISNYSLLNRFDLLRFIPGLLNGVGMVLLFGRIQAIEYFFKNNLKRTTYNVLFLISIVVILPIYAIVQPIFALFNFFKEISGETVQAVILSICFFGKVSFLIAVLTLIKDNFLNRYLISLSVNQKKLIK